MHKQTLFITFDGLSDPLGQSQILPYIKGIAANGYHITILSCEKPGRLADQKNSLESQFSILNITWKYLIYDEAGGIKSRWTYIKQLEQMSEDILRSKKIDLIHCRSYLAALIGLNLKKKYGIPFIFDMRGFWADERVDGGIWKKTNLIHFLLFKYFKFKEKQFLEHASAIVSLTQNGLNELNRLHPALKLTKKTTIIPCCTDTGLFNPKTQPVADLYNITGTDHLIVYTGSIGTWYNTKEMVDCVLNWKKNIPAIKLLILSNDHKALKPILSEYSAEQQKSIICASANYKEVAQYLNAAKAAIFFIKPAYSKIASSPTKMAECWAMDLPIITNAGIGDNDIYFKNGAGGVLVKDFTEQEFQNALIKYQNLKPMAGMFRKIAIENFELKTAIKKYSSIYDNLTNA